MQAPSNINSDSDDNSDEVEGMILSLLNDLNCPIFMLKAFSGKPPDNFGDTNADVGTPEPLHEAITGPILPNDSILFSTGEEPVSLMAESLA